MNAHLTPKAQVKDPVRPCAEVCSQTKEGRSTESRRRDLEIQGVEDEEGVEEAEVMKRKKEVRAPSREEISNPSSDSFALQILVRGMCRMTGQG